MADPFDWEAWEAQRQAQGGNPGPGPSLWDAVRNIRPPWAASPITPEPQAPPAAPAPSAPSAARRAPTAEEDAREARMDDYEEEAARIANEYAKARVVNEQAVNDSGASEEKKLAARAQLAVAEANLVKIQREMADYEDPATKRSAATAAAREQAQYESQIRRGESADSQSFTRGENQASRDFTSGENQLSRDFNASQQAARLQQEKEQADRTAQVQLRAQELSQLQSQDSWVMETIKNQIAAGTLSLNKAGKIFDAYVTKARMPTEILTAVSKAIEPSLPYLTSRKAGESAPGFEAGGAMEQLTKRGGGTYDPAQYAVRPVTLDLMAEAKKAGADWSASGKIPDPKKAFAGVPDIKVNPGESNTNRLSAASSILPASGPSTMPTAENTAAMRAALEAAARKAAP